MDVFISYRRGEREPVETIATALRNVGLEVWLDASMSSGETFPEEIDREARQARAILVCWSPEARESRWVRAEALIGFEQDKLAAAYVAGPDGFSPPVPFNATQAEDLRSWLVSPRDTHASWKSVLRRIGRLCGRADIERFGALDSQATATELKAWLAAHKNTNKSSSLPRVVETLLGVREEEGRTRSQLETIPRERSVPDQFRDNEPLSREWEYHQRRLDDIEHRFEPSRKKAEDELSRVEAIWEQIYAQQGRPPRYARSSIYWPFLLTLATAEVPINRLSFELFFQETPLIAIATSSIIGVLVVFLSHSAGLAVRRLNYSAQSPGGAAVSVGTIATLAILILSVCYGLSILRQGYVAVLTNESMRSFSDTPQVAAFSAQPRLETLIFFGINVSFSVLAAMAAFFSHDPHPDYSRVDEERKAATRRVARLNAQYAAQRASEEARHTRIRVMAEKR